MDLNDFTRSKEDFLANFFYQLNNLHIKYFVYGEYKLLPRSTGDSDLDIIIDTKNLKIFKFMLTQIIRKYNVSLVSYYTNPQALFYRFFYCCEGMYWGLQLDIFYKGFYHKNTCYYPLDLIQNRLVVYNGINVLDIRKGYYINFFKELIHNKKVRKKYVDGFISEIENRKDFYNEELTSLYGKKFTNLVFENLNAQDIQKNFYRLYKEIVKSVHRNNVITRMEVQIKNAYRIFKKKPGYVIVVMGTDGSGKSAIINAITPILNEAFHNGVIYEHLRPNVLPDIGILLKKREKIEQPVTDPHKQEQSGILGSIVRWGYYMTDYIFGYMIKVLPVIHCKSKIFIFDRYYYDYYIDQKRSRTNLPLWIIRLGEFFIAKPDLILCLGGNLEIIYNRKQETDLQEVSQQMEKLKRFCEGKKNAVWIETDVPIDQSVNKTIQAIYSTLSKRFDSVLK